MTTLPDLHRHLPRDAVVVTPDATIAHWIRRHGRRAVEIPRDCPRAELADRWTVLTGRSDCAVVVEGDADLEDEVERCCQRVAVNTATGRARSRLWIQHTLSNLRRLLRVPPAQALRGQLSGVPAFVVGAGPSLSRNAHLLAEASAAGIVVAVNAASRVGHQTATLTVEANDLHAKLEPGASLRLYALSSPASLFGDGPALPIYVGESAAPLEPLLGYPRLATSASGSTTAVALASMWGCDPIVLVGQDLAWTGGQVYAPETGYTDCVTETGELRWCARSRGAQRADPLPEGVALEHVPCWGDGVGTVASSPMWSAVARWLTSTRHHHRGQLINATEGGRHVPGWQDLPLAQVLSASPRRARYSAQMLMALAGESTLTRAVLDRWLRDVAPAVWLEAWAMGPVVQRMAEHRSRPPLRPPWREAQAVRALQHDLNAIAQSAQGELGAAIRAVREAL